MDTKHHIRIVGMKVIDFKDKKTGAPQQLKLAQCVVTSKTEDKGEITVVGELVMPKHLHDTPLGEYLAEFELSVGQDLRIGARLAKLAPFGASANKSLAKPEAKAAA